MLNVKKNPRSTQLSISFSHDLFLLRPVPVHSMHISFHLLLNFFFLSAWLGCTENGGQGMKGQCCHHSMCGSGSFPRRRQVDHGTRAVSPILSDCFYRHQWLEKSNKRQAGILALWHTFVNADDEWKMEKLEWKTQCVKMADCCWKPFGKWYHLICICFTKIDFQIPNESQKEPCMNKGIIHPISALFFHTVQWMSILSYSKFGPRSFVYISSLLKPYDTDR